MNDRSLLRETGPPLRLLLVEDDEAHAAIVQISFASEGPAFELTIAATLADGIRAMESRHFDLVISEWRLPDGEGFDLLKDKPGCPVLIMTSHGNEQVAVAAIRAGALDYIVKSESALLAMPRIAERAMRLWDAVAARKFAEETQARDSEKSMKELRQSLAEKTTLLQEVHHRVKNNLQVVCSLLSMQIACSDGLPFAGPLEDAHSRVLAMSLIHEQIYQSDTLANLNFGEYIGALADRLFTAYCVDPSRIRLELNVDLIHLDVNHAIPCGLILNELLSNSLKHAFRDGREGAIRVSLKETGNDHVELTVADDGSGLPVGFRLEDARSLGLLVVRTLIHQLRADIAVTSEAGAMFRFGWKLPEGVKPPAAAPEAAEQHL
jgi:two-component sensor histidine kinase